MNLISTNGYTIGRIFDRIRIVPVTTITISYSACPLTFERCSLSLSFFFGPLLYFLALFLVLRLCCHCLFSSLCCHCLFFLFVCLFVNFCGLSVRISLYL